MKYLMTLCLLLISSLLPAQDITPGVQYPLSDPFPVKMYLSHTENVWTIPNPVGTMFWYGTLEFTKDCDGNKIAVLDFTTYQERVCQGNWCYGTGERHEAHYWYTLPWKRLYGAYISFGKYEYGKRNFTLLRVSEGGTLTLVTGTFTLVNDEWVLSQVMPVYEFSIQKMPTVRGPVIRRLRP